LEGLHHDGVPRLLPCFFRLLMGGRSAPSSGESDAHLTRPAYNAPTCGRIENRQRL